MSNSLRAFLKMSVLALCLAAGSTSFVMAETKQAIHDRIENLLGNANDFDTIFNHMKKVFAAGDTDEMMEIADTVEYPLTVNGGDGEIVINDRDAFIDQFDEIFTDNVRTAIAKQRYENLAVSSDGVMFGNGEFWMNVICEDNACSNPYWAVTAINR